MRRRLAQADLALTFANRKAELERLLGRRHNIASLSFIPSEASRMALAALDPLTRLGIVSTIPEFLPVMTRGIRRHAPHVADIRSTVLGQAELPALLQAVDVVVYATGAEAVLDLIPERTRRFEYRHVPDPYSIDHLLLPMLDEIRAGGRSRRGKPLREAP